MSKVNIGIKTTPELYKSIHSLLDTAKELGNIKEKNDYFEVTYPYFEEYLRRKELTNTELGSTLNEIERATTIIIKQFMSLLESHESIMKISEMNQREALSQSNRKVDALLTIVEKLESENIRLKSVETENKDLHEQILELKEEIRNRELRHEKEINRIEKKYMHKFTNFQTYLTQKEVN